MHRRRWFLPESPDVIGMLRHQLAVTIAGMDAFAAWAGGDDAAAGAVREHEHRADTARRELHRTLTDAFVTPLEPEDLFPLSRGIDRIINQAKDLVRESEVMACPPDTALAEMAALMAAFTRGLDAAVAALEPRAGDATDAANSAIKQGRRLERVYRAAMAELLEVDDLREVMARRELYRRCSRMGEAAVEVAERVLYAAVKES
ncbi:MAG TPA: DUF47 family protein [Solirubrobacteraceae bacterium]|nr:DUF47 family protein [Solirubrobacteraceae bacterium]